MKQLFSWRGRSGRATFWWTLIALKLTFLVLFVFLRAEAGLASTLVLYPPFFWILGALLARRLRDRGRAPAWLLVLLVPVLGPLWLLVEAGFRRAPPARTSTARTRSRPIPTTSP